MQFDLRTQLHVANYVTSTVLEHTVPVCQAHWSTVTENNAAMTGEFHGSDAVLDAAVDQCVSTTPKQ